MKQKAFSLIELIVVISIVAVLAAIAVPVYKGYKTKAVVARTISLIDTYKNQIANFYATHGVLPTASQLDPLTLADVNGSGWIICDGIYKGCPLLHQELLSSYSLQDLYYTLSPSTNPQAFELSIGIAPGATGNPDVDGNEYMIVGVPNSNGVWQYYCGYWNNNPGFVPLEYLPATCQVKPVCQYWPLGC